MSENEELRAEVERLRDRVADLEALVQVDGERLEVNPVGPFKEIVVDIHRERVQLWPGQIEPIRIHRDRDEWVLSKQEWSDDEGGEVWQEVQRVKWEQLPGANL